MTPIRKPSALASLMVAVAAIMALSAVATTAAAQAPGQGFLPDNRAWELVSPPDKGGGEVMGSSTKTRAAAGGDAVGWASLSAVDPDGTGFGRWGDYMSVRTSEGWRTHSITPPQQPAGFVNLVQSRAPGYVGDFSDDLDVGVFHAVSSVTEDADVEGTRNLYLRDDLLMPGAGSYSLLTGCPLCATTPLPPYGQAPNNSGYWARVADATPDFSHVIFESTLNLADGASGTRWKLYEWAEGTVRLVGIHPSGQPTTAGCPQSHVCSVAGRGANLNYTHNTISDDGRRVFFSSPVSNNGQPTASTQLYMRVDGTSTVHLNASERTDCAGDPTCGGDGVPDPAPGPTAAAEFSTASADGTKIAFTTGAQLTDDDDDSGPDLYVYDATKPESDPDNLTLVSAPEDGAPNGISVSHPPGGGVVGASSDLDYIYFVATGEGQLVDGAPVWADDGLKGRIFVWHDGDLRYIGGTEEFARDVNALVPRDFTQVRPWARVGSDGKHLAFTSFHGEGLTGHDHGPDVCGPGGDEPCPEVYLYGFDGNGGAGELACASCPVGGPSHGSKTAEVVEFGAGATWATQHLSRLLSDDGRYVFFQSVEALVGEDINAEVDVYVFDSVTGERSLLSSGTDPYPSYFLDASSDGSDVFFITRERLSSRDRDGVYDLYTARVDGGLPGEVALAMPPGCVGDACQGAGVRAPAPVHVGSGALLGSGNRAVARASCASKRAKAMRLTSRARRVKRRARGAPGKRAKRRLVRRARRVERKSRRAKRSLRQCRRAR